MKKNIFKRKKGYIFLAGLLFFSLLLFGRSGFSAERTPIICQTIVEREEGLPPENELQVPIGQAADQARHIAQQIIEKTDELIEAENLKINTALTMANLVNECGPDKCLPQCIGGELETTCAEPEPWPHGFHPCDCSCPEGLTCFCKGGGCQAENCLNKNPYTGEVCNNCVPCPPEITQTLSLFLRQAQEVTKKNNEISELASLMNKEVISKLTTSRQRLEDCSIKPEDWERILKGEKAGRFLFSCQMVLRSYIPIQSLIADEFEESCYGLLYCKDKDIEDLPYPSRTCGEDFFCCY